MLKGNIRLKGKKYLRIFLYQIENSQRATLIEGPRETIENILMYRQPFYNYIEKNCYGLLESYDFIEEFVEYLNKVVLTDTYMKVRIIDRDVMMEKSCYKRILI